MTDRPQDAELRERFDAQRRADAEHAPSFDAMLARARAGAADATQPIAARKSTRHQLLYFSGLAAAAVIAMLFVIPRSRSSEDAFEQAVRRFQSDPALGAWQSPTDGLLDVPGSQLISTMPTVGAPQ
jgi:hypothetical protein